MLNTPEVTTFSWFHQIRDLSNQYSLPDPISVLANPPLKATHKRSVKLKVIDWWQTKLRGEAATLSDSSLSLFHSEFMSLSTPHPIWTSAGSSTYEVKKATVQARMLGGRYRTCWLRRHWSGDSSGFCQVPGCSDEPGTLLHIATGQCPGLSAARIRAVALWTIFLRQNELIFPVIRDLSLGDPQHFLAFLVDPTTNSQVISLAQANPTIDIISKLCYMTRTWLYALHKERLKLLGFWTKN